MSPHTKQKAFRVTITGAALVSALAWVAQRAAPAVDQHWVRADSFAVYQAMAARRALTDSLTRSAEMRDVLRLLAGLDSSDRCQRRLRNFCR